MEKMCEENFGRNRMGKSYVYIIINDRRAVLYIGCTNDLKKRLYHHKNRLIPGFSKKYNAHLLAYFEVLPTIEAARLRERKIKGMTRQKKESIIASLNPSWHENAINMQAALEVAAE
jgi:putative endonuclease